MILFWILLAVLAIFMAVSLVGAPYVPTHKKSVKVAVDLLPLKTGDTVVDLGAGDGIVLLTAAKKGFTAIGYEINPVLFVICWLRLLPYKNATVHLANLWAIKLPAETKAVFVFSAGPYMKRLRAKLEKELTRPTHVASYGFTLPGHKEVLTKSGIHLYLISPTKR